MPSPWKKAKVSRISRLVADLQSKPKRGGSLVVETGFPTSLVDLFVKNRDRLKKQSKKKPPLEISRPVNATPPPPCYNNDPTWTLSAGCEGIEQKNEIKSNTVQESVVVEECDGDRDGGEDKSKKRKVFAALLRVFLVVLLALSTRTLTIGITKSAFLFLLLEFVGKCLMWYLSPCSEASTVLGFCFQNGKILGFSKRKKEEIERCEEDSNVCNSLVEEIQVVESHGVELIRVEEITSKETDLESVSGDGRGRRLDMEIKEKIMHKSEEKVDVLVFKKDRRRSTKMKATFVKTLIPKKWRPSKKVKQMKEKELESNSENRCLGEEKSARFHRPEDQQNRDKQEHDDEDELSGSKQDESDDGITTQSQTELEATTLEETRERERVGNSEYLVLCLIVLFGLVRGRVLALVLTIGWCLVLKLGRTLRSVTISS